MRAVGRVAIVVLASTLVAALLGAAAWPHSMRDVWWSRFEQADGVADDLIVVTDRPGTTNVAWTAATVASLLTLITEAHPTTVVLSGIQLDIIEDRSGGADLLALLGSSGVAPTVANVTSLSPGSSVLPRATLSGPPASPAGIGFTVPETEESIETTPLLVTTERGGGDVQVASSGLVAAIRAQDLPRVATLGRDTLQVSSMAIPVEPGQRLRTSYAAELDRPDSPHRVWVSDVLFGGVDPGVFQGKTVFLGPSVGRASRMVELPAAGGEVPLVLAEANVTNTLLTESFAVPFPLWATVAVVAALAALVAVAFTVLPLWAASAAGVLLLVLEAAAVEVAGRSGHLVDPVVLLAGTVVALVVASNQAGLRAFGERRRIRSLFGQYVPPAAVDELLDSGRADVAAAGERLEVTVLFCDLRGFTPLSATLAPHDVRRLLDEFYEGLSGLVLDHGGTVLQYTGDEILAVFGAPNPLKAHAEEALACARAMQAQQAPLAEQMNASGLPAVSYGIGVNSGEVVAAHVGSSLRRQYSVIGATVNVGSRLCSQAGVGEIVFSDDTRRQITDPGEAEELPDVMLKGVTGPVRLWRLAGEAATDAAT